MPPPALQAIYYKYFAKVRPEDRFSHTPLPDMALQPDAYPPVVVQLPMFNEREVCRQVIDAACELEWPKGRLMVQVLDDSTDEIARERIQDAVAAWREAGVNIVYRWRSNREGYKAGAMSEAMEEIKEYDHCAIFDADFHPDSDFLLKTIPYLNVRACAVRRACCCAALTAAARGAQDNPEVGFVQARWVYANGSESLLTRVQEIGLNYHIKCEQYARFASGAFFNFNGTAGVWRRACIEKAGGWNNRTTVEDMDLSLRAYLQGWRFVFLYDVTCLNEVPSSYDAYRKQQHRWSCGPMQLWRKATAAVWQSNVSWAQKLYLNAFFFGTRLFATHVVSFVFYCTLVPIAVIAPEVRIPFWALVYMPLLVTCSTVAFTPRGWMHTVAYVLFENAMCVVKLGAMLSGLLELSDAHEWVVTTKLGNWAVAKAKTGLAKAGAAVAAVVPAAAKQPLQRRKIYRAELGMSALFLVAAAFGISQGRWQYAVFLLLQGATFAAFGLSCGVDGHKRTCCA